MSAQEASSPVMTLGAPALSMKARFAADTSDPLLARLGHEVVRGEQLAPEAGWQDAAVLDDSLWR